MKEQSILNQIDTIQQQIEKLREQTSKANADMKKLIEKRNQLNEKTKKSRQEIAELKSERDKINEKVKLLKQQRDFVRSKIKPINDDLRALDKATSELKKKVPKIRQKDLQEELDAIEWKIQTTSLNLEEEKRLIENVKQLETQLNVYKKIDAKNQKIRGLLNERQTLSMQANAFHNELTEIARKSQELHLSISDKIKIAKENRTEADSAHQAFVKIKEQTAPLYEQIKQLTEQMRNVKGSIKEEDRAKKLINEQALKEKLGSEAKEKLERGEKLSWNEFQLLMDQDAGDDAET